MTRNTYKTLNEQLRRAVAGEEPSAPRPVRPDGPGTGSLLTLADIAAEIGITVDSIRVYHQRATKNRRLDRVRAGDLPEPDDVFGRSPVWRRSTIRAWIERRPGRGAGGGRKPSE